MPLTRRDIKVTPGVKEALVDFADYSGLSSIGELARLHLTEQAHIVDDLTFDTLPRIQVTARQVFGELLRGTKSATLVALYPLETLQHYDLHESRLDLPGAFLARASILHGVALEMINESYIPAGITPNERV